ncbi:hypothetical protein QQ054_31945 [Oscillatoria amoena NRMC-F 0135]|nr:hypothetical protein [Oscillatoria amoena NRMC-F 0135]
MKVDPKTPETDLVIKKILNTIPITHHPSVFYALGGVVCDNPTETHVRTTAMLQELSKSTPKKPFGQQEVREGVEL